MHTAFRTGLLVAVITTTFGLTGFAQNEKRASPHEKTSAKVDGAAITVEYGRPYVKGRQIFGGLVPYGKIWRTGADEATTLVTDKTLVFGSLTVPPGTYTLYTLPGETESKLVINKQTGQWGTQYTESEDLGRVTLKRAPLSPAAEQLSISVVDTPAGGTLKIDWSDTSLSADFTVK